MSPDERRTLRDVAEYLDDVRGHLDAAQSAAATAVVFVRLALTSDQGDESDSDE